MPHTARPLKHRGSQGHQQSTSSGPNKFMRASVDNREMFIKENNQSLSIYSIHNISQTTDTKDSKSKIDEKSKSIYSLPFDNVKNLN